MAYAKLIHPGSKVDLKDIKTNEDGGLDKEEGRKLAEELGKELTELQDLLFFAGDTSCLVVLQGMDTSGKDGMIRCLTKYVNIQGCRAVSFKEPSQVELAHDFLWRIHSQTPGKGELTIFNRSHYEDVLVVRVHDLVPKSIWEQRYEQINSFEKHLAENGTTILKFFLHISKDEQEKRLLDREKDTTKAWKLAVGDWKERERWDQYQRAYEDALQKCSRDCAPWRVVPADHKWYRDIAVLETIVTSLKPFKDRWLESLSQTGRKALSEIAAYRKN